MMYGGVPEVREEWQAVVTGLEFCLVPNLLYSNLGFANAQPLGHLVVEKSFAWDVGLNPLAVDYELRNGPLAGAFNDLIDRAGGSFDVNLFVDNIVFGKKALGLAAIGAPGGGVDN
jgi:hypothetical protein